MLKFTLSNGSGAGTMASNASSSDAESLTSGQVNRLRQNWAVHEGIAFCIDSIIFWMNPNFSRYFWIFQSCQTSKHPLDKIIGDQSRKYGFILCFWHQDKSIDYDKIGLSTKVLISLFFEWIQILKETWKFLCIIKTKW